MSWFTKLFSKSTSASKQPAPLASEVLASEEERPVMPPVQAAKDKKSISREDIEAAFRAELSTRNMIASFRASIREYEKHRKDLQSRRQQSEQVLKNNTKPEDAEKRATIRQLLDEQVIPAISAFEMRVQAAKTKIAGLQSKLDEMARARAELQSNYVLSLAPGEEPDFEEIVAKVTDEIALSTGGKGRLFYSAKSPEEKAKPSAAAASGATDASDGLILEEEFPAAAKLDDNSDDEKPRAPADDSSTDDNVSVSDVLTDTESEISDEEEDDWDVILGIPKRDTTPQLKPTNEIPMAPMGDANVELDESAKV